MDPEIIFVLPFSPHITLGIPTVLTFPWRRQSNRVQPAMQPSLLRSLTLFPAGLPRWHPLQLSRNNKHIKLGLEKNIKSITQTCAFRIAKRKEISTLFQKVGMFIGLLR